MFLVFFNPQQLYFLVCVIGVDVNFLTLVPTISGKKAPYFLQESALIQALVWICPVVCGRLTSGALAS